MTRLALLIFAVPAVLTCGVVLCLLAAHRIGGNHDTHNKPPT